MLAVIDQIMNLQDPTMLHHQHDGKNLLFMSLYVETLSHNPKYKLKFRTFTSTGRPRPEFEISKCYNSETKHF